MFGGSAMGRLLIGLPPVSGGRPRPDRTPDEKRKTMTKYHPRNLLTHEPVALSAAVVVVANTLALFGVVDVTADQLAGVNTAVAVVLSLFTRNAVTPTAKTVGQG